MKKNVLIGGVLLVLIVGAGFLTKDLWWKKEAQTAGPTVDEPGTLTLAVGEEKRSEDLLITLMGVENDSRCAVDVQCISAGDATVRAALRVGTAAREVKLTLAEEPFWFEGYFVDIAAVYPEVRSNEVISPNTYRVTFALDKGRKPGVYAPTFEEYPITEVYTGDASALVLDGFPAAEEYRDDLEQVLGEGVNFAGSYAVAEISCGDACVLAAVLDVRTGTVAAFGLLARYGFAYSATSSVFIVNPASEIPADALAGLGETGEVLFGLESVPAVSEYYALKDGTLTHLGKFDVRSGEKRACEKAPVLAYNPITEEERNYPSRCEVPFGYELREQVVVEEVEKNGETWQRQESEEYGVAFEYRGEPEGYTLTMPDVPEGDTAGMRASYVLMNTKEYTSFMESTEAREAPPSITLSVFENTDGLAADAWTQAHTQVSNFDPSRAKLIPMKVDGVDGFLYNADGLYPTSNVVVARGEYVYLLTGQYIARTDKIYRDFDGVLYSIKFLSESTPEAE